MGEQVEEYSFSNKEVVTALIKLQGLHEGIWMLSLRFGIAATNVQNTTEPNGDPVPAAVVPIVGIGLRKKDKLNPLAVDAADANPRQKSSKRKP